MTDDSAREIVGLGPLRNWLEAVADLSDNPAVDPLAFMKLVGKGARNQLEALSQTDGWQSIESAPKDGTQIFPFIPLNHGKGDGK